MPVAELNGVSIAYDVWGEGEPVLAICGTSQQAFTWQLHLVPALTSAGYRVVTYDNRGIPPSAVPPPPYSVDDLARDAAGLVEHLELGPCRVVGYSLGAFTTQELALARPDLVRAAALIAPIGRLDTMRRALFESWVELDRSGIEPPRLYQAVVTAVLLFAPGSLADDARMQTFIDVSLAMPPLPRDGMLGQHLADLGYDGRLEALEGLTVPSLVVGFEHDVVTSATLAREVAGAIPDCRYVEIAEAGHGGPFERPDELNAALVEFFASV